MENNELKMFTIKNHTCYYFNDIIRFKDFDSDNILLDDKSYGIILIYDVFHKNLIGVNPLHLIFNKIDGLIRVFNGSRYLVLLGPGKYDVICNRFRYLVGLKSGLTYVFSHSYTKIKVDSHDYFPLEKALTLHNVIKHIKSILNNDQNHFECNISLEKCSYQLAKSNCNKIFWYYINVEIW